MKPGALYSLLRNRETQKVEGSTIGYVSYRGEMVGGCGCFWTPARWDEATNADTLHCKWLPQKP